MPGPDLIAEHFEWATRKVAPHLARAFGMHRDDAETACTHALMSLAAKWAGPGDFREACYKRCRSRARRVAFRDERRLRARFGHPVADFGREGDGGRWSRRAEAAIDARAILSRVGPEAARLLAMRHIEGRDFAEIGRLTGCNEATAKRRTLKAAIAARSEPSPWPTRASPERSRST